jgi:hypothetical protein
MVYPFIVGGWVVLEAASVVGMDGATVVRSYCA